MKKKKIKNILKIAFEAGLLKRVVRTGWKNKNVKDPESVAEHSYRVAVLAMLLAPEFDVDQQKLVKMALIHDLGESVIGDLIWEKGGKVIGSQKDKHKDEKKAIEDIFEGNEKSDEYIKLWKEFEDQSSKEAKFLKLIDKLEMLIQAYEYEQEGNDPKKLQEFWENAEKYLKESQLEGLLNELQKMQHD